MTTPQQYKLRDHLNALEKLLREADDEVASARGPAKTEAKRRRNAINAACNALHRAAY